MKILMIGLGSIGQRHLRNIRSIYGDSPEIIAYRVKGLKRTFSDSMQIRENVDLESEYNVTSYFNLSDALSQSPEIAFISNVTKLHITCAIECAKAGCHLFLEKPLSDSMDGIDKLKEIVQHKKLKVFVGFQNRYNPAILQLKESIENGDIGTIISARSEVGERLSTMHAYENYKDTYMARNDLGGGVILNQMIHEIDYLRFIFGELNLKYASGSCENSLNIDVDDSCEAILRSGNILISLHADFYRYPPCRCVFVLGDKGWAKADLISNTFTLTVNDITHETTFENFTRNSMFISELKSFINSIQNDTAPEITLDDGIESLKISLQAKEMIVS